MSKSIQINQELINDETDRKIRAAIDFFKDAFKEDIAFILPSSISNIFELNNFFKLHTQLSTLKDIKGFHEHCKQYKNDYTATNFVSIFAEYLVSKVDDIELEPTIENQETKPDIRCMFNGNEIYFECKEMNFIDHAKIKTEHLELLEIFKKNIRGAGQYTVTYTESFNDESLLLHTKRIGERREQVKGNGTIYNSKNDKEIIKVEYRELESPVPPEFNISLDLDMKMYTEAGHHFATSGFTRGNQTFLFQGPIIDYKTKIEKKIKKSSKQAVIGKSFFLVIPKESILGDFFEAKTHIENSFQPTKNTRFSGVIIVEHMKDVKCIYIPNPFSSNALNIEEIFKA